MTTLEENFNLLDDLPFCIYFDLETISRKKKLFLVMKIQKLKYMWFHTVLLSLFINHAV